MEQVTGESAAAYRENEPEPSPDQLTVILIIPCCSFLARRTKPVCFMYHRSNHCPRNGPSKHKNDSRKEVIPG